MHTIGMTFLEENQSRAVTWINKYVDRKSVWFEKKDINWLFFVCFENDENLADKKRAGNTFIDKCVNDDLKVIFGAE